MSTERIRDLNDAFRSTFGGGKVMMTSGVYELQTRYIEVKNDIPNGK